MTKKEFILYKKLSKDLEKHIDLFIDKIIGHENWNLIYYVFNTHTISIKVFDENKKTSLFLNDISFDKIFKSQNMEKLEIERKFLLKRIPKPNPDSILEIEQFYISNENRYERYRKIHEHGTDDYTYKKTIKKRISHSVNSEDETDITQEEYDKHMEGPIVSYVSKNRHKFKIENKVWEVDVYNNMTMVVAEIELSSVEEDVVLPEFINENLIMEVTGIDEFSNFNLGKI